MFCKKLFSFHDWTNWETIEKGKLYSSDSNLGIPIGIFEILRKKCNKCGEIKMKKLDSTDF